MSDTPHTLPPKETASDPLQNVARRRILVFVTVFILLLAGAIALVLREEKRRSSLLIRPEPVPAPEITEPEPEAPAPIEITPPPQLPPEPTSPALQQSRQMEAALAAFREAETHLKAQQFPQAEERAIAALKAYPEMAAAQRMLGLIYLQQGRINQAIGMLEISLRNEPLHPEALSNLAFAYLQNQNPGLAMELIETCRRLHPEYKPALLQHGIMLLTQPEDAEEAAEVLREAVETFPNLPGPRNNLAVALARIGDREGAREQLRKLLELDPGSFSALFNMGGLYAQETNAPAAVPWLRKAMQQMPPDRFRSYLNDPDLETIRDAPEFHELLQELDPVLPGPKPALR